MAAARSDHEARTRKLYRYISEAVHKVDEGTNRSKTMLDLFAVSLEIYRQKLRENCEKLIFADPILYGRRAQDLLWRKGYYETISAAKRLRAGNSKYDDFILSHVNIGIGHYHQLISKIQIELNIDMTNLVDYAIVHQKKNEEDKTDTKRNWGRSSIQTCLVYLGDLCRYKMEFEENGDCSMAVRYYLQAASIDSKNGMPYNQLGTLFTGRNYYLDSVRYYLLCLSCGNPFEGAEVNLTRVLEKNGKYLELLPNQNEMVEQQETVKNFICRFLNVIESCYFDKNSHKFTNFCTETLYDLKTCLVYNTVEIPDPKLSYQEYNKFVQQQDLTPSYLSPKILHKIVSITLLSLNKFSNDQSKALPMKAFALAVFLQLLQKLLADLTDIGFKIINKDDVLENLVETKTIIKEEKPEEKNLVNNKKSAIHKVRRRRRIIVSDSEDSSDCSESENESNSDLKEDNFSSASDGEEDDEFDHESSDNENGLDNNGDDQINKKEDKPLIEDDSSEFDKIKIEEKPFNELKFVDFINDDNVLSVINLMIMWLMGEDEFLISCRSSAYVLFQTIVDILNIAQHQFVDRLHNCKHDLNTQNYQKMTNLRLPLIITQNSAEREFMLTALPEDNDMKSTEIFSDGLKDVIWEQKCLTSFDANLVRLLRMKNFGRYIVSLKIGIRFTMVHHLYSYERMAAKKHNALTNKKYTKNNAKNSHVIVKKVKNNKPIKETDQNAQSETFMRSLGKLWLSAQVNELESEVHSEGHKWILPAYVVVDAEALTKYIYYIKKLVHQKKCMVLVPTIVLQLIDEMKKESCKARYVIRWLEEQLLVGSNYLRTQIASETAAIESLQILKKTGKEMNNSIQIIEFCNYFILKEKKEALNASNSSKSDDTLSDQTSVDINNKSNHSDILVLLTGIKNEISEDQEEPNFNSLIRDACIPMEHIQDFFLKMNLAKKYEKGSFKYKNKSCHKKR